MTDLATTIDPKSDQLNADDLIPGPRTITVTNVKGTGGDQPIAIHFEGDHNKPFKPCKSMRRVLVNFWGRDGATYAGRRMTLWRDPKVLWAGEEVGGIRISHMSDIGDSERRMALTASKGKRPTYVVKPLRDEPRQERQAEPLDERVAKAVAWLKGATTRVELDKRWKHKGTVALLASADREDPEGMAVNLRAAYERAGRELGE